MIFLFAHVPAPAATFSAADLKTFYDAGLRKNGIVGSSLFLIRDKEAVAKDFYGDARKDPARPVDENTAYHWASITKTFTGIAIMQLRDRGLLKLDDPIVKYVPELREVHDPWGPVDEITIRHAMTHSTGLRSATWPWGGDKPWHPFEPTRWSQIVAMMPYTEVEFKPGSRFSYSNLAVVFLGQIIERLSGDDYEVYVDKNILKPLQMYQSYFDRSPYHLLKYRAASYNLSEGLLKEAPFNFDSGITVSNGGLNAPLTDMSKYIEFLLGNTPHSGDDDLVLKRSSLEEMFQPQLKISATESSSPNGHDEKDSVGLSFFIRDDRGRRFIGHSGSQNGFISHFYLQPESRRAYIVAFNTDATDKDRNTQRFDAELREYLFDHFFAKPQL
ncbi:MAG: serine hydrolase domain-containing protein [Bryobacteraceae bacterium]